MIHADECENSEVSKHSALIIAGLILLALVVRLAALERLQVLARDGIRFLELAAQYGSGSAAEALAHPYHPLYPVLIAAAGSVIGSLESAGKAVSLLLSSLTVIPVFALSRVMTGFRAAVVASVFYIFQPYSVRLSVNVLSDAAFLFFLMSALALGVGAFARGKANSWRTGAAGLSAGCAYLTRPEGVLAIGFLLLGCGFFVFERRVQARHLAGQTAVILVAFALLALPYALFIKEHTGAWQLSMKPSVSKSLKMRSLLDDQGQLPASCSDATLASGEEITLAPVKPKPWLDNPTMLQSATVPVLKLIETYPYVLFLFFVAGCRGCWRQGPRYPGTALMVLTLMYLGALCYIFHSIGYVSRRHFVPLIAMSLPVAGVGFWEVHRFLAQWVAGRQKKVSAASLRKAPLIMVALTILILLPKSLKLQGEDKIPVKQAGLWIKAQQSREDARPLIMAHEPLIAYYAAGSYLPVPPLPYSEFVAFVRRAGVDYVVFDNDELEKKPGFAGSLRDGHFRPATARFPGMSVYEVVQ